MRVVVVLLGALIACDRGAASPDFAHPEEEARGALGKVRCVRSKGRMACLGETAHGIFGNGKMVATSQTFVTVPGLRDVRSIAISGVETQACAVSGRHAYCWGAPWSDSELAANGAIGRASAEPQRVGGIGPVVEICAGLAHACGRTSDGDVICWGDNQVGAIADPASEPGRYAPPTRAPRPDVSRRFIDVVCGPSQTCAVTDAHDLYCWGGAVERDGQPQPAFGPTLVATGIVRAEVDERLHVCGIATSGLRTCWSDSTAATDHAYVLRRQQRR